MVGRARAAGPAPGSGRDPAPGASAADPGAYLSLALVGVLAGAVVIGLDSLLAARVRAGSDAALRLSVVLNWVGVDRVYVLARALGIGALVLSAGSVVAGLEVGRRRSLGRRPVPRLNLLHRQISLVTVAVASAHACVPFASAVTPEGGWSTALVPLAQPVSWGTAGTLAESAGILSLYLMVVLGPTWYLASRRPRVWWVAHRAALLVYVLAVVHTLFLGTDFYAAGPARVALIAAQVPLTLLLAARLAAARGPRPRLMRAAAGVAVAASVALAAAACLGLAGWSLGGFRL